MRLAPVLGPRCADLSSHRPAEGHSRACRRVIGIKISRRKLCLSEYFGDLAEVSRRELGWCNAINRLTLA